MYTSEDATKSINFLLNLCRINHLRGQKFSLDNQISDLYTIYQKNKSNDSLKEITLLMNKFFDVTQELTSLEQSLNKRQTKSTCN